MITLMYQTRHLNNTSTVLGHVDIYNIMLTILTYCHHIYIYFFFFFFFRKFTLGQFIGSV